MIADKIWHAFHHYRSVQTLRVISFLPRKKDNGSEILQQMIFFQGEFVTFITSDVIMLATAAINLVFIR